MPAFAEIGDGFAGFLWVGRVRCKAKELGRICLESGLGKMRHRQADGHNYCIDKYLHRLLYC